MSSGINWYNTLSNCSSSISFYNLGNAFALLLTSFPSLCVAAVSVSHEKFPSLILIVPTGYLEFLSTASWFMTSAVKKCDNLDKLTLEVKNIMNPNSIILKGSINKLKYERTTYTFDGDRSFPMAT